MKHCTDPRHGTPCPQPCSACVDECDPQFIVEHWTVQRVKDELPDVDILVDGRKYCMTVYGRQLQFAIVRPFECGSAVEYTFSWQTIADCLNKGVPLRA
jgi:hypothetical protein